MKRLFINKTVLEKLLAKYQTGRPRTKTKDPLKKLQTANIQTSEPTNIGRFDRQDYSWTEGKKFSPPYMK